MSARLLSSLLGSSEWQNQTQAGRISVVSFCCFTKCLEPPLSRWRSLDGADIMQQGIVRAGKESLTLYYGI